MADELLAVGREYREKNGGNKHRPRTPAGFIRSVKTSTMVDEPAAFATKI
jgi:hypothetical protein